eukprot:jgi/Mesen1/1003/ME000120S00161
MDVLSRGADISAVTVGCLIAVPLYSKAKFGVTTITGCKNLSTTRCSAVREKISSRTGRENLLHSAAPHGLVSRSHRQSFASRHSKRLHPVSNSHPAGPCRAQSELEAGGNEGFCKPRNSDDDNGNFLLSRRETLTASVGAAMASSLLKQSSHADAAEVESYSGAQGQVQSQRELPPVPAGKALAPGLVPSAIIKGCWQLSGGHRGDAESDRTAGRAAVEDLGAFANAGITSFDTADHYGPSESLIGEYLRKSGRGKQARGVQVFTKYCVFSPADMRNPTRQAVRRAVDRACGNLGVNSLDLLQFYWQDYKEPAYVDAALHLSDLQAEGRIKHIGVTNFDAPRIQAMLDRGVRIVSSQVQYSLLDRRPENGHVAFCRANGIGLLPYGVVGGSFLTDRYVGMPYEEAQRTVKLDTYSKSKYLSILSRAGGWGHLQELLKALKGAAEKHSVSVATVATRWVLDQPQVAAVIIGARNARHLDDHKATFTFALDDEDKSSIEQALATGTKPRGDVYTWERGGVF